MKKTSDTMKAIITTMMICLSFIVTVKPALAESMRGHTIIITQIPDAPDAPRTPVVCPFIAELMDGSDSVLLEATDTVGIVYVQISSTAGDNYSTYFDTSDGSIILPISGYTGYYTLTINFSGVQFVGEFSI